MRNYRFKSLQFEGRHDTLYPHFTFCVRCRERETNIHYGKHIHKHRGHHYAGKACLLLFELAGKHGMDYLIITCNPDNHASRKTCEYAGGELLEIVELPEDNDMRESGESEKCIYRFQL